MASFRKRGRNWYYRYVNADGEKLEEKGCPDRRATEEIARGKESDVARIRAGLDPKELDYRSHVALPLSDHVAAWKASVEAKGATEKHVELFTKRAKRVIALLKGAELAEIDPPNNAKHADLPKFEKALTERVKTAKLADLTKDRVQKALATLRSKGRSLATCNHHRAAIKAFSAWCYDSHRTREDVLRGVTGFNVKEDRRHDRRTISVEELLRLVEVTQRGEDFQGMSGPVRGLVYRLAVATGLRYSEIASIYPESFDWEAPSVTVAACYTKNGQTATLPLPIELAIDLAAYVATREPGQPVFDLPEEKGAMMLRVDLLAAGIDYRDESGLVFDFHALRCQTATLADAAGVSPRVVQRLMRHSTLELTGKYTRPRTVDVDAAAMLLPSLKPQGSRPESLAATGTDGAVAHRLLYGAALAEFGDATEIDVDAQPISDDFAHHLPTAGGGTVRNLSDGGGTGDFSPNSSNVARTLQNKGFGASMRALAGTAVITGEATRTPDLRIMRPPL